MAPVTERGWLVPVVALFVAAFAVCTSELVPAGLLPVLAAEFAVDIPTAGLLITGYALGVAILSPILALMTGNVSRKRLLLAVMVTFMVGTALCAVSTSYWMLLGSRLVVASSHGLFFGLGMVMAMRLAPEGRQTTAVSLIVAGVTLANIAGVPIGTAIGNLYGWRATFWIIAVAGAAAFVAVWFLVDAARIEQAKRSNFATELRAAVRPIVLICFTVIALFMVGVFALYAYIVPLLTTISGVPLELVPWVLFGMGATGFFGNLLGGRLGDWNPTITMAGILVYLVVMDFVLVAVAGNAWGISIALWATWCIGFGFPAPVRARIFKETRDAPTFAATLTSTAFNLGIAAGAALGGLAITAGWSYGQLPFIGAACFSLALAGTLLLVALDRRAARRVAVTAT